MEDILKINTTDDGRIEFTCNDKEKAIITITNALVERLMTHNDQSVLDMIFAVNVHSCVMLGEKFTEDYVKNLRNTVKQYRGAVAGNAN